MSSCLDSGQLVRHKETGKVGVSTIDPYGVWARDEVAISFSGDPEDPNKHLGNGFPVAEWEVVKPAQVSRYYRMKYKGRIH